MKIAAEFEKWLRNKHLKECASCREEGRARLMDHYLLALTLFKQFSDEVLTKS